MKLLALVPSLLAVALLSLVALATAGCGARGPAPADPATAPADRPAAGPADRAARAAPSSGTTAPTAGGPQPSSGRAASAPPAAAQASADAAVEMLLGGWVGAGESPFGEMPFAALFERLPDGGARAWADDGKGSAIAIRLQRAPGGWRLREQASLPGVGTQAYTLHLVAAETASDAAGARARLLFAHPERPGFLDLELSVAGEELVLAARLRGQPHVRFTMKRLPAAALPTLASRLHAPGTAPPADDASLPPAAY